MEIKRTYKITPQKQYKSGVYYTTYGNACEYIEGNDEAFDLDMREEIPFEAVDFDRFIREIE